MGAVLKREQLTGCGDSIRPLYATEEPLPPALPLPEAPPAALDSGSADLADRHARLLHRVVTELVQSRQQLLEELRAPLLDLSLAVAREVIGHEACVKPEVIEHSFRQALTQLHFATRLRVRLHPNDLTHLQSRPDITDSHPGELEFVSDPDVERGGCRVESDRGGVDATIATQVQALRRHLQGLTEQIGGAP